MQEVWKPIRLLNFIYEVSNTGKVRNSKSKKELYQEINELGYKSVKIQIKNSRKSYKVHRLVALEFIDNPNGFPQINHMDENPSNNNVNNLEWCTNKYNSNYGNRNKKLSDSLKGKPREDKAKQIVQYDLNMNFLNKYKSIDEAVKCTKISRNTIRRSCKKEVGKERKFIFRYREDVVKC